MFQMKCPSCNFENPDQFKFCGECGTRIVDVLPEPFSADIKQDITTFENSETHSVDAERRHITVMFCDLVGSTRLSEKLDPEDFRQLLHVYQDTCVYAVNKYEGHLAQYLGDGVLIYFGFPNAHADDTQRAVRCGLEILSELERLNELQTQFPGTNLSVRIGIHTGLVVVGEISRDKKHGRLALGNTPNIAARIQALAEPDSIIISSTTYRLVRNFFKCHPLGAFSLKGITDKINTFKVEQEIEVSTSFKTLKTGGMTTFIGRENEVQQLLSSWEEVKNAKGSVAFIVGEPGIGKTRLLRFFEERIKAEDHTWLVCRCISYYKNSAFYPIINLINSQLKIGKNETSAEKIKKLEEALGVFDFDLNETVPIIASLISIPIIKPYRTLSLTPEKQKEKTIQILLDWLIKSSSRNPLLFVIEDVHWADSSTLEHLTLLLEKIDQAKIFVILTSNSRSNLPVYEKTRLTEISLNRLTHQQIENMVQEVTGGKNLPSEIIDLLLLKTDGVPLFVEEMTKMLIESNYLIKKTNQYELKESLLKPAVPDTLQDTLMARLDQLGAVKEVVQLASVVGREFSYELIYAVSSLDESLLKKELNSLVEADILEIKDDSITKKYVFRQVLIQDAAYNSILKSMRQDLHLKIAGVLEVQFKDFVESHPQVMAYHFTRAKDFNRAIEFHLKSGRLLVQQSAHREAISQLQKGLELLKHIDDIKRRNKLELDLQITLGIPLLTTKGYGAEEVGKVYERASELSQIVGNIPQLFPALVGQYRFYLLRGNLKKALDISELLLSWAQTSRNSDLILEATRSIGVTLFHMGEVTVSLGHLEKGIQIYDPSVHKTHAHEYGTDPAITCLSYAALAQCLLGYSDKAIQYGREAIQLSKGIDHPFSQVFALNHHSWLFQFYNDTNLVDKYASELVKVSMEYGFPFWQVTGLFFKGWVLSQTTDLKTGIKQMEASIKAFQNTGAGSVLPYFMTALAEIYLRDNQPESALNWLKQAEKKSQKNSEHFFDAEIYRVRAEVLFNLGQSNKDTTEFFLWRAIETARRQNLKSLELRALLSLAHIGGRKKETMTLLKDTYDWFEEGLDTPDLKQAHDLLYKI
jgi:class 3 adenylate cyclase/predicted ATPase/anti-anti-sigma regulatory factor